MAKITKQPVMLQKIMKMKMNKLSKIILIFAIAVLGAGFLPSFALANGLVDIVFEQQPLFQETNFLPGQSVMRWVDVENKSSEVQPIGVEVIDYSFCTVNCFSEQLELNISNGSTDIYTESLDQFFNAGDIKLSDLAAGNTIRYYFTVTFLPESGNQYQEKTVNFDFKIGSLGKESIGGEIGGGGNGSFFITGLEIFNETILDIGVNEVTITWNTNKPATSRVIYSSEFQPRILQLDNPPNYGYYSSTVENPVLTTDHQMVITGLASGTTYYFRCVSRGSLAVSKELKFTTAGVAGETAESFPILPPLGDKERVPLSEDDGLVLGEEIEDEGTAEEEVLEEMVLTEETAETVFGMGILCWFFLILIIILLFLSFLLVLSKKGKKPASILSLITSLLLVLYFIFCCRTCWALILVALILFILFLILSRKRKENIQNQPL